MDKYTNIMCISESFTTCMVYNEYNMCDRVSTSYSEERKFMQKILYQIDTLTKLHMFNIFNMFASNVLLIFSTILSFVINDDTKCLIISK